MAVTSFVVLRRVEFQERPAGEAETAKRTGLVRRAGHVILFTI
jgi:hypothetical protein